MISKFVLSMAAVSIAGALFVTLPEVAQAQTQTGSTLAPGISPTPKGTIGAGLIGAELGMAVPAIIGMKDLWPYLVFPAVGAGGGVALGYLWIDQSISDAKLSVAVLMAGTALVIPTLVLTFVRSAYDPEDEGGTELQEDLDVRMEAQKAGPGLVRISPRGTFVAAPAVVYSPAMGTQPESLEVSVLSGRFF